MRTQILALVVVSVGLIQHSVLAADPPTRLSVAVTNTQKTVTWPRPVIPAWETNQLRSASNIANLSNVLAGAISVNPSGYVYRAVNNLPYQFYHLQLGQMSSNDLLTAQVLNRLAYGPTPDDLGRVQADPQAYIDEQLAPQAIPANVDNYTVVQTNSATVPATTNWTLVTVTGLVSSSTLYMYLTTPGEVYLDDVSLRYNYTVTARTNNNGTITTNVYAVASTNNALANGDFEQPLAVGWTVAPNMVTSQTQNNVVCSGASSLRMIATAGGAGQTTSISQVGQAAPATTGGTTPTGWYTNTVSTVRAVLSFAYLQNTNSHRLTLRLSGSGTIISGDAQPEPPEWIYATATGLGGANKFAYLYLSGAGEGWVDDVKLVNGSQAEVGTDLLQNGSFEAGLGPWQAVGNHSSSVVDSTVAFSGSNSVHLKASGTGDGNGTSGNSVVQNVPGIVAGAPYTLSYWYRPATRGRTLTARLSGSLVNSLPDSSPSGTRRRLDKADWGVTLNDYRSWFCHNALASPRQLLEVLSQFFENHFVTYHGKTADYFDRYYDGGILDTIATDAEYREMSRWRQALLNPNCTFYDLLKIHIESPAQIIYLDTVGSRGDGNNIANENYARELFELFTMGVDNGYDQNDIVTMSRVWSGWTVDIVEPQNVNNPFAPRSQRYGFYDGVGYNAVSNIIGVWSFTFNTNWHGTNRAPIFTNAPGANPSGPKTVPARFGAPWAGTSYQLAIPRRLGTNGIQDGYDVINHLASGAGSVFTAEYVSIKLCRLFVHDDFPNPMTITNPPPEYAFYDYTNPNSSAEADLVHSCIVAWDTPGPDGRKGHIRAVLRTIFDSELFRGHAGSRQKVKTPLEFVISALRSMRSGVGGPLTISTDGRFNEQLSRMGGMSLFNRADPDGYPEAAAPWVSAGTLAERLRFVQALCTNPNASSPDRPGDAGAHSIDPVTLMQRKLPASSWLLTGDVADLFVRLIFFGEGKANLDLYRQAAVNFLNDGTADLSGTRPNFLGLTVSNAANSPYDTRVRGMVSMLMTLQRFQEQ